MPELKTTDPAPASPTAARRILQLCPERVPEFIHQSRSDRTLSRTMAELNRTWLHGEDRERETAHEALVRLGFVYPEP